MRQNGGRERKKYRKKVR